MRTALLLLVAGCAWAQSKPWTLPHTPDGQPDLQGIWTNATITPLERPADLAGKQTFTAQEAAAYEKRVFQQFDRDRRDGTPEADLARAYGSLWWDAGNQDRTDHANLTDRGPPGRESSSLEAGGAAAS